MNRLLIFFILGVLTANPAYAAKDRVFSIEIENDVTTPTDQYYTNGVRAGVAFGPAAQKPWMIKLADKIPFLSKSFDRRIIGFAFGQNMFTPADTKPFTLTADDRPYAGWLYGEVSVEVQNAKTADYFILQVGVIGPASLADRTQRSYHRLIGVERPNGWDHQLSNEPGIVIGYQRVWKKQAGLGGDFGISLNPHAGVALGNVYTYAAAGLTLRIGQRLGQEYGPPPRISPAFPGSRYFRPAGRMVWYLFAGLEGRAVARDLFLDGNTFTASHSVDKKHLVADLQVGLVVIVSGARISFTHVFRTKEFTLQPKGHEFSGLNIAFRF